VRTTSITIGESTKGRGKKQTVQERERERKAMRGAKGANAHALLVWCIVAVLCSGLVASDDDGGKRGATAGEDDEGRGSIRIGVQSMLSNKHPSEPVDYYSLDFCRPVHASSPHPGPRPDQGGVADEAVATSRSSRRPSYRSPDPSSWSLSVPTIASMLTGDAYKHTAHSFVFGRAVHKRRSCKMVCSQACVGRFVRFVEQGYRVRYTVGSTVGLSEASSSGVERGWGGDRLVGHPVGSPVDAGHVRLNTHTGFEIFYVNETRQDDGRRNLLDELSAWFPWYGPWETMDESDGGGVKGWAVTGFETRTMGETVLSVDDLGKDNATHQDLSWEVSVRWTEVKRGPMGVDFARYVAEFNRRYLGSERVVRASIQYACILMVTAIVIVWAQGLLIKRSVMKSMRNNWNEDDDFSSILAPGFLGGGKKDDEEVTISMMCNAADGKGGVTVRPIAPGAGVKPMGPMRTIADNILSFNQHLLPRLSIFSRANKGAAEGDGSDRGSVGSGDAHVVDAGGDQSSGEYSLYSEEERLEDGEAGDEEDIVCEDDFGSQGDRFSGGKSVGFMGFAGGYLRPVRWFAVRDMVFRRPRGGGFEALCSAVGVGAQVFSACVLSFATVLLYPPSMGVIAEVSVLYFILCSSIAGVVSSWAQLLVDKKETARKAAVVLMTGASFVTFVFASGLIVNACYYMNDPASALRGYYLPVFYGLCFSGTVVLTLVGYAVGFYGRGSTTARERISDPLLSGRTTDSAEQPVIVTSWRTWLSTRAVMLLCSVLMGVPILPVLRMVHLTPSDVLARDDAVIVVLVFLAEQAAVSYYGTRGAVYFALCRGDYAWWWTSFMVPFSSSAWIMAYSAHYYAVESEIEGVYSMVIHFVRSAVVAVSFGLAQGFLGFLSSYKFLLHIYTLFRIDKSD
jgi:hypothetical protein